MQITAQLNALEAAQKTLELSLKDVASTSDETQSSLKQVWAPDKLPVRHPETDCKG
jgi:hypothetical protein